MRHKKKTVKLGRTSSHREVMLASLVCHLIERRRIKTTLQKARAARVLAEKMVTLGKKGTLGARRLAVSRLHHVDPVQKLFAEIAPAFAERKGGYTRIMKLGQRSSDNAEMVLLEWVETGTPAAAKAPAKAPGKTAKAKPKKESEPKAAEAGA